ncbi:putative Dynamin superfamily, P-loop containing nucleoside triphosphate hydrolase [Lupinus albus]|uniref:Putative Dynamin superfamily, P-loop containing nucleoside triphosphate hydrolase n=1 Tax=Lupinus albus TaxID=3870 RepID=A0A6A4P4H2_LUPAL|nr:putative Dynamin superfamily, P-loop containing nucleoside triphosphate hydrolase [Lupinus albus]
MPFSGLTTFGTSFLSKFECSQMHHPLLEHITFVDSPGVLSGDKQRTQRAYDFTGVTSWFAAKCDLILLLFDPHKLDISDEFKRVISSLRGNDDKVRVVLNKADQVDTQQLMRVYGALMWSLGKVLNTPEVMHVYVQREFHLPPGDFPNVEHYKEILSHCNIDKFEKLKQKMIQAVDDMLGYDIPNLLEEF